MTAAAKETVSGDISDMPNISVINQSLAFHSQSSCAPSCTAVSGNNCYGSVERPLNSQPSATVGDVNSALDGLP